MAESRGLRRQSHNGTQMRRNDRKRGDAPENSLRVKEYGQNTKSRKKYHIRIHQQSGDSAGEFYPADGFYLCAWQDTFRCKRRLYGCAERFVADGAGNRHGFKLQSLQAGSGARSRENQVLYALLQKGVPDDCGRNCGSGNRDFPVFKVYSEKPGQSDRERTDAVLLSVPVQHSHQLFCYLQIQSGECRAEKLYPDKHHHPDKACDGRGANLSFAAFQELFILSAGTVCSGAFTKNICDGLFEQALSLFAG